MQNKVADERLTFNNFLENSQVKSGQVVEELSSLLIANNMKLSVIESFTGGEISHQLVQHPGCSRYFLGGIVAYHPRMKVNYGRVSPKIISTHGVVSAMVTQEMANGIQKTTQSDVSIASNGIAGPQNKPGSDPESGTVFLSWNIRDKIKKTKRYKIEGGRTNVIDTAVFIALSMCLNYVKNECVINFNTERMN